MGLIKESKKVDLIIKSEPWTDKELAKFRKIMKAQKAKRKRLSVTSKRRNASGSKA
jgi:hypothetical protein